MLRMQQAGYPDDSRDSGCRVECSPGRDDLRANLPGTTLKFDGEEKRRHEEALNILCTGTVGNGIPRKSLWVWFCMFCNVVNLVRRPVRQNSKIS